MTMYILSVVTENDQWLSIGYGHTDSNVFTSIYFLQVVILIDLSPFEVEMIGSKEFSTHPVTTKQLMIFLLNDWTVAFTPFSVT